MSFSLITPAGGTVSSVIGTESVGAVAAAGNATNIELRKRKIEAAMDNPSGFETPTPGTGLSAGQLYRVLPEKETALQPDAMLGSTRVYDVTGVTGAARGEEVSVSFPSYFDASVVIDGTLNFYSLLLTN